MSDSPAIRTQYQRLGVEVFYRDGGADYRNPHEPQLATALRRACALWRLDLSRRVLDLAAGSGEATLVLRELGATQVDGIDPFTFAAYERRTGQPAERFTFQQIAAGALAGRDYGLIVCSFAMHLCEPSRLPALATQLAMIGDSLLVLTPHKRPVLQRALGWGLTGELLEQRVRCRCYRSAHRLLRMGANASFPNAVGAYRSGLKTDSAESSEPRAIRAR
jgi:SAM-dependent methyltransferase